jgi:hypothetical protein
MMMALAAAGVAMCAAGFAVGAQATGSHEAPSTTSFHDAEVMPGIWADDTAAFPEELAPGVDWPTVPPASMTGENTVNEDGLSAITVSFFWLCSWEEAYLAAVDDDDPHAEAVALDMISRFTGLPAVEASFENKEDWRAAVLDPVIAGDGPATIEQDFRQATCDWYEAARSGER